MYSIVTRCGQVSLIAYTTLYRPSPDLQERTHNSHVVVWVTSDYYVPPPPRHPPPPKLYPTLRPPPYNPSHQRLGNFCCPEKLPEHIRAYSEIHRSVCPPSVSPMYRLVLGQYARRVDFNGDMPLL